MVPLSPTATKVLFPKTTPYKSFVVEEVTLSKDNPLNHSGMCFTKKFWNSKDIYGNKLRYRNDVPYEDLTLWRRAVTNKNINITIIQ